MDTVQKCLGGMLVCLPTHQALCKIRIRESVKRILTALVVEDGAGDSNAPNTAKSSCKAPDPRSCGD